MPTWNVTHKDGDQGRYEGMTSHKLLRSDFIKEAKHDDGVSRGASNRDTGSC